MSGQTGHRSFESFVSWEGSTRDAIDLKKTYVDMAGDLIAGVVLSQIVYWHLPSLRDGRTRLRVERDGHMWVAKTRDDWWSECRVKPRQADRALKLLEDAELIACEVYQFAGFPTKHVRILKSGFMRAFRDALGSNPEPEVRSDGSGISISPFGDNDPTDPGEPITETTAETTTTPPGGVPSTPRGWLTLLISRTREVGFEATPRQHDTWANELGSKKRRGQDPQEMLSLVARVTVKASEGRFCSLKNAEEGPAGERAGASRGPTGEVPIKGEEGRRRRTEGYEHLFEHGPRARAEGSDAPEPVLLSLVPDEQRDGIVLSEVSRILQRRLRDLAGEGGEAFERACAELGESPWLSDASKQRVIRDARSAAASGPGGRKYA